MSFLQACGNSTIESMIERAHIPDYTARVFGFSRHEAPVAHPEAARLSMIMPKDASV
jgi:hypothetical protein